MKFFNTNFDGLWVIETESKSDERGFLTRLFCKNEFDKINFPVVGILDQPIHQLIRFQN